MANVIFKNKVNMDMGEGFKVTCGSGEHKFVLDEPKSLGGTDVGMNPIEALLGALGACKSIVAKMAAGKLGIPLDSIAIECKGTLDPDGFKGTNPNAKIGLSKIETVYNFKSSASKEELNKLIKFVEKHCPVMDTILNPPEHSSKIESSCGCCR